MLSTHFIRQATYAPHILPKLQKHQGFYYLNTNDICYIFRLFVMSLAKIRDFLITHLRYNTQIMQKIESP